MRAFLVASALLGPGSAGADAVPPSAGPPPAALAPGAAEPSLIEVQAAAIKNAGGPKETDASRVARARAAHWAPVVRGLFGVRDNEGTRDGELRGAPLHYTDRGQALSWGVTATWDLPQVIFARDETQLIHAHLHLEKARQAASKEAIRLYLDRQGRKRALAGSSSAEARRLLQEVVRLTADLDSLTGGLFLEALSRELAELSAAEPVRPASLPAAAAAPASAAQPSPVAPRASTPSPSLSIAPQEIR